MNYMTIGYENIMTIFLAVIGMLVVITAQIGISSNYSKYKNRKNSQNLSGQEVARKILDQHGLKDVHVVSVSGNLTDHYDPTRKVVKLSSDIFNGTTIAAMAVAAHEVGHAIQDQENYSFMRIRSGLVPFVNFVTYLGYFSILISLIAGMTGYFMMGILVLLATLLFQFITLPVEFDASKRAQIELDKMNLVSSEDQEGIHNMLRSAAMTYVASVISSLLSLLRLILMFRDRDD